MDDLRYIDAPPALAGILTETEALAFGMASEPRTGALLRVLAASKPGGRLLELGTGTGIATAWLLAGMDASSTLISVDVDARVQSVARRSLGHDPRLSLINVDGAAFLRSQDARTFDMVFADAMPGKYDALDEALRVIKDGGFYVVDDMLPQPNWPEGHSARVPQLMDRLAQKKDFQLVPLCWATGLVLAVKTSA